MRIACPDAEFLYIISKYDTDYWNWRKNWTEKYATNHKSIGNVDYLVREIATPKMLQYIYSTNTENYKKIYNTKNMCDFLEYMTYDLEFREKYPGDHINYWTFEKLNSLLISCGFTNIIRSKWGGSCSVEMQNLEKFDKTEPLMSLYVEVIK